MDPSQLLLAGVAIALGGFMKGATGAGAPVVGVPILAAIVDVPFAVAVFAVVNLFSNIWHAYAYRKYRASARLIYGFAVAGAVGAGLGSVLLASLSESILNAALACVIALYIMLRLCQPGWSLERRLGIRLAPYTGFIGGIMQGAGGISAPISITFLNAMRLHRDEFIATASIFFVAMSLVQIPTLTALGVLTLDKFLFALAACGPLFLGMPVGEWASKYLSPQAFDRAILFLLALIAVRLIWGAIRQLG